MNLTEDCIRAFSKFAPEHLRGPIESGMPRHFLLSTLQLQPALRPAGDAIEEIADSLAAPTAVEPSRNPEVYWEIARLSKTATADLAPILEALRTQAGITPPADADLRDGLHRLVCVDGGVYRVRHGAMTEVDVVTAIEGFAGRILLPCDGLFSDMVEERLYPRFAGEPPRTAVRERMAPAIELVASYSSALFDDIQRVVRLLVLTPDLEDDKRWSYNLRMAYFGAIFINPYPIGVFGSAESLIHEYCHQRLWQWWTYDPPGGLPAADIEIRSPVTDRMKPIRVMIHALVVYVLANDFYLWALESDRGPAGERGWLSERQRYLAGAIPRLHRMLSENVESGTAMRGMLDLALERFEADPA